jgi:integrase
VAPLPPARRALRPCPEHSSKTRVLAPSKDHGKGKRWQVRWRDAAGEQQKENFAKRSQADTRAATIEADLARGLYVDPAAGKESFRSVAERWRTSAVHRGGTSSRVERALRLHIYPTFGDRPVVTIRPSEVQAWVKDRSQVLAPSTLRVTFAYMVTVLHTAVRDRTIALNPCAGIKLPEVRRAEIIPLHVDAVRALIEAAPPRHRAMILLAAASGLRQGEVFGLEVDCIDFLRREVTVRQQLITPDKGVAEEETPEPYLGEPKTYESYRTVPLAAVAVDALAAHLQQHPAVVVDIEDRTDPRKPKLRKAHMLFTGDRNERVEAGQLVARVGAHGGAGERGAQQGVRGGVRGLGAARPAGGTGARAGARAGRGEHARPAALLRLSADQEPREREDGAAATRSLEAVDHARHLHPPVARRRGHNPGGRRGGPRRCARVVPSRSDHFQIVQLRRLSQR